MLVCPMATGCMQAFEDGLLLYSELDAKDE